MAENSKYATLYGNKKNDYITLESITLTNNLEDIKDVDYVVVSVGSQSLSGALKSKELKLKIKHLFYVWKLSK